MYLEIFWEANFGRGLGGAVVPLMGPGQSPGGYLAAKLPELQGFHAVKSITFD